VSDPKYIKYGGIRFTLNRPEEEINRFVRDLGPAKKDSLFEVVKELRQQGLIDVDDEDLSTIDDVMLPFLK